MAQVLVVEDDAWYRELLVEMLSQDGHQATEAGDGEEAMAILQQGLPDLMIIDMLMPKKDGVDTITEIVRLGYRLPIIAISGGRRSVTAQFNIESAKLLVVNAGLIKPFSRADLRQAIREVLV